MTKEEKHKILKEALTERSFRVACDRFNQAYDVAYVVAQEKSISDPSIDPASIAEQAAFDAYDSAYDLACKAEEVIQLMKATTIKNIKEQQER